MGQTSEELAGMRGKKVLIILHQKDSTPGRIGHWLRQRGVNLDMRYPLLGDALPQSLSGHYGVISFGGPGSVNDAREHPEYQREAEWLSVPLREGKPFIGICLGAQLLSRHLGARVGPHPQGLCEAGYYPVRPTELGWKLCDCWPDQVYQWHREGFELPHGAELLIEGEGHFPNQAYVYGGKAFALQFHPEVTTAMLHRWTVKAASMLARPGAKPAHSHFQDRMVHDPSVACWLDRFLDYWLTIGTGKARRKAA